MEEEKGFYAIVKAAFGVLVEEPKVFMPRIATTIIYSALIFHAAGLSVNLSYALALESAKNSPNAYTAVQPYTNKIIFLGLLSAASFVLDVLSYAMYPSLVEDHKNGRKTSLNKALRRALRQWKTLLAFSLTMLSILLAFILSFLLVYEKIISAGRIILLPPALALMLLAFITVSVLTFFIIPASVIEEKGALHAYKKSFSMGLRHKGEVIKATVFFMAVGFATILAATLAGFRGASAALAFTAYAITRIIQTVSYTYMNIINPYLYLRLEED